MQVDYYIIGQRIRKFRKAHSFSQEELAEKVGISTTHMSHIETGNTKLSLAVLVKIALVLEVNTDDILFDQSMINKSTLTDQIIEVLDSCTPQELVIIYDIIKDTQVSLSKHL